jgi:hypothetical protein
MNTTTLIFFAITGGIACTLLGLFVGRLATLKGFTWTLKDAIGILLIGAFIGVLFILFWKEIPAKNEQLIVYMLGQLSGFVGGVISAHYVHKAGEERAAESRQETARVQAETAGKLAEAVKDAVAATPSASPSGPAAGEAARDVADAADEKAEEIERETKP